MLNTHIKLHTLYIKCSTSLNLIIYNNFPEMNMVVQILSLIVAYLYSL